MQIDVAGQEFVLLPQKAVFWNEPQMLLVADAHLGKVAHFRQSGIGIPSAAGQETFLVLHQLISKWKPKQVLFLGDLFHSHYNSDFSKFANWRSQFSEVEFSLVLGNHEVESPAEYARLGLTIYSTLPLGPFYITHEPGEAPDGLFNLAGHIHPGISLAGFARQRLKMPCFWFGDNFGVFPAFGQFTGYHTIRPENHHRVYAVAGSKIVTLSSQVLSL